MCNYHKFTIFNYYLLLFRCRKTLIMPYMHHTPKRKYKDSDAEFTQVADGIIQNVERDATELLEWGITPEIVAAAKAKRHEFADKPSDNVLTGMMMIATMYRNDKHKELEYGVRRITDRIRHKYGEGHGLYSSLNISTLSKQTAEELVRTARSVVATCTTYLPMLLSEGISSEMLADVLAMSVVLDGLIDAKINAVNERDMAVFERIRLGNELYDIIVNFAGKGKSCWYGVHPIKHSHYVLYTPTGKAQQQKTEGTVDAESLVNTSVQIEKPSTTISIKNTGTVPIHCYFAAEPTDTSGSFVAIIAPADTVTRTAKELGYTASATRFNIYNPSGSSGSYSATW